MRLALALACFYAGVAISDPHPVTEVSRRAAGQRPSFFNRNGDNDGSDSDADDDDDDENPPGSSSRLPWPFGPRGQAASRGPMARSKSDSAGKGNRRPWWLPKPKGNNGGFPKWGGNGYKPKGKGPKSPSGGDKEDSGETAPGPSGGQAGNGGDGDKETQSQTPPSIPEQSEPKSPKGPSQGKKPGGSGLRPTPPGHRPDGSGGTISPSSPLVSNEQCPKEIAPPPSAPFEYLLYHRIDVRKPLNPEVKVYILDLFLTTEEDIQFLHSKGAYVICYFNAGGSQTGQPDFDQFKREEKGAKIMQENGKAWEGEVSGFFLGPKSSINCYLRTNRNNRIG